MKTKSALSKKNHNLQTRLEQPTKHKQCEKTRIFFVKNIQNQVISWIFPRNRDMYSTHAKSVKMWKLDLDQSITIFTENQHFSVKSTIVYYYTTINVLTKEVTKELISRNIFWVIAFWSTFPHCETPFINFVCSEFPNGRFETLQLWFHVKSEG